MNDLRYALRLLRRSPGFAATAAGTLALAIGSSLAIFSIVYGILLRPLPVGDEERLAVVYGVNARLNQITSSVPLVRVREWQQRNSTFQQIAALTTRQLDLLGPLGAERAQANHVTSNFFETLDVSPVLGRVFTPDAVDECVISHVLWTRRFKPRHRCARSVAADRGKGFHRGRCHARRIRTLARRGRSLASARLAG